MLDKVGPLSLSRSWLYPEGGRKRVGDAIVGRAERCMAKTGEETVLADALPFNSRNGKDSTVIIVHHGADQACPGSHVGLNIKCSAKNDLLRVML